MALSESDSERLRRSGFFDFEIDYIANATTPDGHAQPMIDLNNPAWQAAMKTRSDYIKNELERTGDVNSVYEEILAYYRKDFSRDPFDFIRYEYGRGVVKKIDFLNALEQRKKRRNVLSYYRKRQ